MPPQYNYDDTIPEVRPTSLSERRRTDCMSLPQQIYSKVVEQSGYAYYLTFVFSVF